MDLMCRWIKYRHVRNKVSKVNTNVESMIMIYVHIYIYISRNLSINIIGR